MSRSSSATAPTCSRRSSSTWATCARSCINASASGCRILEQTDAPEFRLITELGKRSRATKRRNGSSIALEAIVENYREYRDYNTTTTHSDHGELLYTLVDFLRLRADYDRVAWNLRPVVMAHEILVRQNRPAAAELWQQALADRTAETSDANLARFEELCNQYGVRLPSVAERLGERFTRPLAIDRVRALVAPRSPPPTPATTPIAALQARNRQPGPGAGRRRPRPARLAGRPRRRSLDGPLPPPSPRRDDAPRRIEQVRLSWEEWQRQIAATTLNRRLASRGVPAPEGPALTPHKLHLFHPA